MSQFIFAVSKISYYLKFPRIRSYHAAFFHGIANRMGEWYPFDSMAIDASEGTVAPLNVTFNRYRIANYCNPGSWPIVSREFRSRLDGLTGLRFHPTTVGKVVDYFWAPGVPIPIQPCNLTNRELFGVLNDVDATDLEPRFEMMSHFHQRIICNFAHLQEMDLIIGTPPGVKVFSYSYSEELLTLYPIHWFEGAMIFAEHVWENIKGLLDLEFYVVRKYNLSTGLMVECMGPEQE